MLFGAHQGGKPLHPEKKSSLPISKIKTYGVFNAKVQVHDMEFHNFSETTKCNKAQHVFERNPTSADYIPIHEFSNIKFVNVEADALVWIEDPNPGWANPTDCGDWPCTAPENVILKFTGTEYDSSDLTEDDKLSEDSEFQIVSDNESAADAFPDCTVMTDWSAYRCTAAANQSKLGVLVLESLDADKEDREAAPLIV
jgi:hypothetical protein